MKIRKFDSDYLPQLAPILTAQRARIEAADPRLPHCPDPKPTISQLTKWMKQPTTIGYLAEHNGKPLAFMIATPIKHKPNSYPANFFPLRYALLNFFINDLGNSVKALYNLYTTAAQNMLNTGYLIHLTFVYAVEEEVLNLWAELGFGHEDSYAAAKLSELPVTAPDVDGLAIRRATQADTSIIRHFFELMQSWHARSPIFHPVRPAAIPNVYAKLEDELKDPHYAHFIAELNGKPVGICDGNWTEKQSPRGGHTPYAYLRNGFVIPERHGQGIGRAVCLAFYNWLRTECNAPYLYLDYTTTNPASRDFWLAQEFRPITYGLQRVILMEGE